MQEENKDVSADSMPSEGEGDGSSSKNGSATADLETRAVEAEKKYEGLFNDHLYLKAEFENYKKRMQKERSELLKYSGEKTIIDFLPAFDNLHLALDSAKRAKDTQAIVDGLEMTYKQLIGIFEGMGCEFFASVGESFDPTKHEAVLHQETADVEPNTVLQEYQRGCLLHGKLIRPAKVIVSKPNENKEN